MTMALEVSGTARFDGAVRCAEIADSVEAAIAPLVGIGRGIQVAERAVVAAVATALWFTHGKGNNATRPAAEVVGVLKLGMDSAGWHGSFAHGATVLLGKVMRLTPEAPLTRAECVREADHLASFMFAQQTKRREAERAKRAEAKKAKAEQEKAEREQEKAEQAPATDAADAAESPVIYGLTVNRQTTELTEAEAHILEQYLREIRAAAEAQASANRKAERDGKKAERDLRHDLHVAA